MTQNKIAPMTTTIRIPITSVSTMTSRHFSGNAREPIIGSVC
jgi:hypothetical protein